MFTGCGRDRGEGPEELHLIILDGFRSRILGDPVLREVLRCLRCGACLNFCPVYGLIGGHSYPWIYSGPIGVALTGRGSGRRSRGPGHWRQHPVPDLQFGLPGDDRSGRHNT